MLLKVYDINSLYPNIIVSHNISLETLFAVIHDVNIDDKEQYLRDYMQITEEDNEFFNNYNKGRLAGRIFGLLYWTNNLSEIQKYTWTIATADRTYILPGYQLLDLLKQGNFIVTANGTIFRSDRIGVLAKYEKSFLENRAYYKNLYAETKDKIHDAKQLAYKILANSLYGIFGTNAFLYNNVYLAEAITITGMFISFLLTAFVNHIEKIGSMDNFVINRDAIVVGKMSYNELQQHVLYRDTDSLFILTDKPDIDYTDLIAKFGKDMLMQTSLKFVKNENLEFFLKHSPRVKLEFEADGCVFTTSKKRYFIYNSKTDSYKLTGYDNILLGSITTEILVETLKDIVSGKISKETYTIYTKKLREKIENKTKEILQTGQENTDVLNAIIGVMNFKSNSNYLTIHDLITEHNSLSDLQKVIKKLPIQVRAAIIYNTLRENDKLKILPNMKVMAIKGKYNMKALKQLADKIEPIYRSIIPVLTNISQIIFVIDDYDFIYTFVDLSQTIKELSTKIYNYVNENMLKDIATVLD